MMFSACSQGSPPVLSCKYQTKFMYLRGAITGKQDKIQILVPPDAYVPLSGSGHIQQGSSLSGKKYEEVFEYSSWEEGVYSSSVCMRNITLNVTKRCVSCEGRGLFNKGAVVKLFPSKQ